MNIDLVEIENKNSELFFNIINKDNNDIVGILFTRVVRKIKMWYNLSARYERRKLESSLYGVTLIHI